MAVAVGAPGGRRRGVRRPPGRSDWLEDEPASEPYSREALAARRRAVRRPRLVRLLCWLVGVVVLLGGIVALNVAALRTRVASERLDRSIAELRDERETLQARLSKQRSFGRIDGLARRKLGLVEATGAQHVSLPAPAAKGRPTPRRPGDPEPGAAKGKSGAGANNTP